MVATRTILVSREIGGEERKKKFGVDLLPDVEVRHREGDVVPPMYKQLPRPTRLRKGLKDSCYLDRVAIRF